MGGRAEMRKLVMVDYYDAQIWELYFVVLFLANLVIVPTILSIDDGWGFAVLFGLVLVMDLATTVAFYHAYKRLRGHHGRGR